MKEPIKPPARPLLMQIRDTRASVTPQTTNSSQEQGNKTENKSEKSHPQGEYIPWSALSGEKLRGLSGFIRTTGLYPRITLP